MTTPAQDENIAEWVKALRSGEYKQTTRNLCSDDGGSYCCLGVAGKLIGLTDDQMARRTNTSESYTKISADFGLRKSLGEYDGGALFAHNDCDGWNFNQIADVIESRPEGLFV